MCAEYITGNARLDDSNLESWLLGKAPNNLRYADDTTLMAESEEELQSLLQRVKEESRKPGLRLNIHKSKIMAPGPITSLQREKVEQWQIPFLLLFSHFSPIQLFVTPRTAACQASLSFTISQTLLKLMSTESMISSNHLILCHPFLLLPSIFPSTSNELALRIRWPKYWSFSISPSNEYSG